MYLYTGMADVALLENTDIYDNALLTVWENLTEKKSYVTGGIGSSAANEGFGEDYDLPNETAYAETCANIGSFIWNSKMNLLYGDSKYADVMETTLYNSILSGINFDGDKFFYSNPHYSNGTSGRSEWFGCACCPPNLMRLIESLGSYIYTQEDNKITLNLYIGNDAEFEVNGEEFEVSVDTEMPWNGKTELEVTKADGVTATLRFRVPEWATGTNKVYVGDEEYAYETDETGYINITREWTVGDKVILDFEMKTVRYYEKEEVTNDVGYVAVKRGPIIFVAEEADNDFNINKAYLPATSELVTEWSDNLMNDGEDKYGLKSGMYVTAKGIVDDYGDEKEVQWKLIPYYAWNNRGNGDMLLFISEEKADVKLRDYAEVSASYSFDNTLNNINDNNKDTFWNGWSDPSLQTSNQWVMYDFGSREVKLTGVTVNWYDDRSGVVVPEEIILEVWDSETESWKEVTATSDFTKCVNKTDNVYTFEELTTTKIRMTMVNGTLDGSTKVAAAIFEWDLDGEFAAANNSDTEEITPVSGGNAYKVLLAIIIILVLAGIAGAVILKRKKTNKKAEE